MNQLHFQLVHAVTTFDRKASTRRGYNPYALGQYLARVEEICKDVESGATPRAAILAGFEGRLADVCLRAIGESTDRQETIGGPLHYVPVAAKD